APLELLHGVVTRGPAVGHAFELGHEVLHRLVLPEGFSHYVFVIPGEAGADGRVEDLFLDPGVDVEFPADLPDGGGPLGGVPLEGGGGCLRERASHCPVVGRAQVARLRRRALRRRPPHAVAAVAAGLFGTLRPAQPGCLPPGTLPAFAPDLGHVLAVTADRLAAPASRDAGFFRRELVRGAPLVGRLSPPPRRLSFFFWDPGTPSALPFSS